jgi:hypothetical protein
MIAPYPQKKNWLHLTSAVLQVQETRATPVVSGHWHNIVPTGIGLDRVGSSELAVVIEKIVSIDV